MNQLVLTSVSLWALHAPGFGCLAEALLCLFLQISLSQSPSLLSAALSCCVVKYFQRQHLPSQVESSPTCAASRVGRLGNVCFTLSVMNPIFFSLL